MWESGFKFHLTMQGIANEHVINMFRSNFLLLKSEIFTKYEFVSETFSLAIYHKWTFSCFRVEVSSTPKWKKSFMEKSFMYLMYFAITVLL